MFDCFSFLICRCLRVSLAGHCFECQLLTSAQLDAADLEKQDNQLDDDELSARRLQAREDEEFIEPIGIVTAQSPP